MSTIMDGKALAQTIKQNVKNNIAGLSEKPNLAVVVVGNNPASEVYVKNKSRDCEECGIACSVAHFNESITTEALLEYIDSLNTDPHVTGILVQMPLPPHINEKKIIEAIDPKKDVDCFHPLNCGGLMIGKPYFLPCTPAGVMDLLAAYNVDISGKNCVVIGRSNIVGRPLSILLSQYDGTVTVCHSKTKNLANITRNADILVAAVGKKNFVTADMVKQNAVVIDVGINRNEQGKLCGDVAFDEVKNIASCITPVPGGVGPMTRAELMKNIWKAAMKE